MATYFTLLTPAGLAKVANAQLTNQKIEISEVAAGDGNGVPYQPTGTETALKREVWRGAVSSVELDSENLNWIVVEAIIPASAGGFSIREVGLFDTDGTLIAIGNYPDTYKPVIADGSTMDLALRTIIEVGNTSNVTLRVDPNVIVASRKYVDDRITTVVGSRLSTVENQITEHLNEVSTVAAPNKIPKALASGKIDNSWLPKISEVQVFTASGTWTKPANASFVMVDIISGGGGGKGGQSKTNASASPGTGGGGGGRLMKIFNASALPDEVSVIVGAGGTGGNAVTTGTSTAGDGGASQFWDLSVEGGTAGSLGGGLYRSSGFSGIGNIGAASGSPAEYGGGGGGIGGTTASNANGGGGSLFGAGGGGAGGGSPGSNDVLNLRGGGGGVRGEYAVAPSVVHSGTGPNGYAGDLEKCGAGGGGGAGTAARGYAGGNGGIPGGGGGGGGGAYNGTGGKGGNGARGEVRVYAW